MRVSPWKLLLPNRLLTGEATRMRIPRRKAHALLGVTLFTRTEAIHRKICRMRRREYYARDAQCTLRAECKTRPARRGWLCASSLIGSFVLSWHISHFPSLCISLLLFVEMKDRDSLPSFLHAWDSFVNFVFLPRFYEKNMSFSLFSKFILRIQLLII